ncbi:hypothetical protein PybrP1_011698 [[Pythium] brassicae (nom. inval.)]|nr:hypothetical protein PybrP1_011698 [[Pythium] brassicae (nom. inval.)]
MTPAANPAHVEARLRAFYARHNPGNDQNIAEIVRRFAGRELELSAKLKKKYGEDPELLAVPDADTGNAAASSDARPAARAAAVAAYERGFAPFRAPVPTTSSLDFRSESFDPLRALLSANALPGLERTQPLDHLLKCRHLLPESDPHYQKLVVHVKKSAAGDAGASSKAAAAKRNDAVPTLFERLADTYMDGPFTVLRRCFLERRRVVVVVRRVNSIRGTCAGYLKAFDKHMNLVLLDVDERYVTPEAHAQRLRDVRDGRLAPNDALFSVAAPGRNRRFTSRQHAKQLFIRGDNVVMVFEARERRGGA